MNRQPERLRQFRVPGAGQIQGRDLPFFCRSLAAMLNTGMAVGDSLRSLESQQKNTHLRAAIIWMRMDIESGHPLSDSMRQFPSLFDPASIGMILAAEMTGQMPETLLQIAGLLETRHKLRGKIRSALIYPLIVTGIAMILVWFLVTFVTPAFTSLYESLGHALPAPTRALLASAHFLRQAGFPLLIIIFVGMFALGVIGRTSRGRRALDGIVLAMPLAGSLLQKACLARFARTYSALIRGGIATPKALGIAAEATGNRAMADAFGAARAAVESGAPLASALGGRKYMPHTFIEMLRAGEKTGRTDEMLDSVAEYYESEVNTAVSTLPSIIMPLLIVVIGVVVGAIVVAALMPLFEAPGLVQ